MRPHLDTMPCRDKKTFLVHIFYVNIFVHLEDCEARKTRHELDEVRLAPPGHAEGPLHEAGPGEAPDPVLHVVIKLGAPPGEAGLASVREVSAPLTVGRRLQSRVIRGHSVARGQIPGDNNNNPLLEMVQDIPDLLAWGKIRDNCHC